MRNSTMSENNLKTPYMFLQDPEYSKLLIVALPETTPINEAAKLQGDLRRSGIEPYAWIANQSMSATPVSDPLLKQRAAEELPQLEKITSEHANMLYTLPWVADQEILKRLIEDDQRPKKVETVEIN